MAYRSGHGEGPGHDHELAQRSKPLAGLQRDEALIRVSRTRRAVFVGAAGLSAGVAALVSAVAPGRSLGAKPTYRTAAAKSTVTTAASSAGTRSRAARMPPLASPSELGLQAPGAAPQPGPGQSSPSPAQQQAAPAASQAAPAPAASAPAAPSGGVVSGGS